MQQFIVESESAEAECKNILAEERPLAVGVSAPAQPEQQARISLKALLDGSTNQLLFDEDGLFDMGEEDYELGAED